MKNLFSLLIAGALLSCTLVAAAPRELPVEKLFETPTMSGLRFSPDGTKILALVPHKGRQNLVVIDLVKGVKNLLSDFADKSVRSPFWANNERILFFVDDDGREAYSLYAVNADGRQANNLVTGKSLLLLQRLSSDPKNILVGATITHRDWHDVALLNVQTGKLSNPIVKAPGSVDNYVVDRDEVVRFATVSDLPASMNRVFYRESNKDSWKEVASYAFDSPGWYPLAFDGDNRTAYVASDVGRKTRAVFKYDTSTHALGEMVCGSDTYDASGVIYDEWKKKVVGFNYAGAKPEFVWTDPEMAAIHQKMCASLPDTIHMPTQFSADGSKIIFYSYSDRDPGVYYLYDRKNQKLSELAVVRPSIDPDEMAEVRPISYRARDGLLLHGYLALPKGREPKNLPLVVHPHGGPYGPRDTWTYNPEVQFYANRGFAVLQVNFRGSGGYGDWFEAAGFKKWGLEMQDDLSDGVQWAIKEGVADPKRVVISGASYGGYAVMAGLVYTPELYCAGINYVGVVDINTLIPRAIPASRLHWMNSRIGNLADAADRKRIYDTSPVNFADRIRVPLLMAYGRNDPRVRIDQAYDIERALKRAKVPYKLIIEDKEGHGFDKEEKRIAFYREIDAFLKEHVRSGPN